MIIRLLAILILPGAAIAQTACPGGVAAGSAQCGPSPQSHVPAAPQSRYVKVGEWKNTWGALAMDVGAGDFGTSSGKLTKAAASKEAMSACMQLGAKKCDIQIVYRNQCVVLAWPAIMGASAVTQSGATIEEASSTGLALCKEKGGGECRIEYANCTEPFYVGQ